MSERKAGTIPRGTYDAVIRDVATIRRKEDRSHMLRVIVRTVGLDRDGLVWQGLADGDRDDPFDMNEKQVRAFGRFADRLGLASLPSRSDVPAALVQMREHGEIVQAKVTQTKIGQQITLSRSTSPAAIEGPVPADVADAAQAAQEAHEKVLQGLGAVRLGLACAAEGCHMLHKSGGWQALGFATLGEYLAAPEVTLSRPTFYALSEIWQRYVLDGGLDAIALGGADRTKLEVPLRALGEGLVTAEVAVADATSMPRADLRDHYAALLGDGDGDGEPSNGSGAGSRRRDVEVTDEMVERGARVLDRAYDRHELTLQQVARDVLNAALGVDALVEGNGRAA